MSGDRRAPWRSWRAGACRRSTGRYSCRCAFRAGGCPRDTAVRWPVSRASVLETGVCRRMASMIWLPMVCTGLMEVIGSWKIMAMSLPRMSRISLPVRSSLARSTTSSVVAAVVLGRITVEENLAGDDLSRRRHDLDDRACGHALAAAALAHHAHGAVAVHAKIDAVDRLDHAFVEKKMVLRSLTSSRISSFIQ